MGGSPAPNSTWAVAPVASVRTALPAGWWELPLDRATRNEQIAQLVDERIAGMPDRAPLRDRLVALLISTAAKARAAGAVFAAQTAALEEGKLVLANCLVVIAPVGAATGHALLEQLRLFVADRTPGARCDPVKLAGTGSAVRVVDTWVDPSDGSGQIGLLTVRYYVPLPGSIDTAVFTFTSPQVGMTEILLRTFEDLANEVTFLDADGSPVTDPGPATGRGGIPA